MSRTAEERMILVAMLILWSAIGWTLVASAAAIVKTARAAKKGLRE